jgi:hypothetical protein
MVSKYSCQFSLICSGFSQPRECFLVKLSICKKVQVCSTTNMVNWRNIGIQETFAKTVQTTSVQFSVIIGIKFISYYIYCILIYTCLSNPMIFLHLLQGSFLCISNWFKEIWICSMSRSFHVNFSFSGSMVHEKKIFKYFSYINTCQKLFPLLWPHPTPRGHDMNKFESALYQEASMQISAFLAQWFMRRRF